MTDTSIDGCRICRICGSTANPTREHIIPQTLWRKFGLDPNHDDLARCRTVLCKSHNKATGALHQRPDMIDLITTGAPVTKKTLLDLGDWAVWVTLLLGLSNGDGVLPPDEARRLLSERFDGKAGGPPGGVRVYAARVAQYVKDTEFVSHMVGVQHDGRIAVDYAGHPIGFRVHEGAITVSESIGLGRVALLVLSRSFWSGPDHNARVDEAARTVGLELIHPLGQDIPDLAPRPSHHPKVLVELGGPACGRRSSNERNRRGSRIEASLAA